MTWSDVIGQFEDYITTDDAHTRALDESADFFVEVLQSECEMAEPWPVSWSECPAPPHQHKPESVHKGLMQCPQGVNAVFTRG